ncbi:prolyl oligopeptidase family serine peptidase [Nakamurella sp. YIM 132087]|uniref:Prolyl oligopeptidase family serine peptidase n=1 Tax=Nakamurella alba TaxID=2665158 RepID=A0A7K1FUE7_9ACTN|nr:prolyl oligopeptidase family serine peptidase [Nakamurella alba]
MSGLTLSPDGSRLVVAVATPDLKGTRYSSALWEVDPAGAAPAHRLTRGSTGETGAAFTASGDLLFTAKRVDPEDENADGDAVPLWLLPAAGGEPRAIARRRGGFGALRPARSADTLLVTASLLPGADLTTDDDLRKARKDAGVSAILHDGYPVRYWDHDLGPDQPHLLVTEVPAAGDEVAGRATERPEWTDLTPAPGAGLQETDADLAADGSFLVTSRQVYGAKAERRAQLVRIEVPAGTEQVLVDDPGAEAWSPRISPDGTRVVYVRETLTTPREAPVLELRVVDATGGEPVLLGGDWDRWPSEAAWLPDSSGLLVVADDDGRAPVFRMPLDGAAPERLTDPAEDAAFSELRPAPDGDVLYAMRASYAAPAHPVRIPLTGSDAGRVQELPAPAPRPELPGRLEDIRATASDGTPVRGWLALPHDAGPGSPVPLLLWIHGGPLGSWNAWSWRWNPWLMVAQGYAVLLPDPALSTGYGQAFVQRGWGAWGAAPYTDLLAITDAVEAREDIDETRTAAMGGSFGGYMANWVAGHTDRFDAIVTHASLWALDDFGTTTDVAGYWVREMSPEMATANSPHLSVSEIRTPMLVVHGDKDYRVPIGQGLRLWYELLSRSGLPAGEDGRSPHRFLYFPSENHWVLTPQHATLWYRVVLDFLAEHVLGADAAPLPALLGGPSSAGDVGE